MSKKREKDIVVTCLGSSIEQVVGSCWSVEYNKKDGTTGLMILECGLNQSGFTDAEQYENNKRMLDGIGKETVAKAEYVLLSHAHA